MGTAESLEADVKTAFDEITAALISVVQIPAGNTQLDFADLKTRLVAVLE